MTELYIEAIAWYNFPLTVLLCVVVLYWIVASVGVLGDGADLDLDADGDVDLDMDIDADGASHGILSAFSAIFRFVNMDHVPVAIVVSILTISMWALSIIGNYFFAGAGTVAVLIVWFASFVIGLLIVKAATTPLARGIRKMKAANKETEDPIVGRSGFVRSGYISTETGQVEIEMRGAPLIINARVREGSARLKKGDECLVIDEDEKTGVYYVKSI
ncbi:MAG: DUF1449 family protein [Verrucomicrobiales bacterium]